MDDDDDHDDLYARFEGGENGKRRGQEVESDANWVPSYTREAGRGDEEEEEEEKEEEKADDVISRRRRRGTGKGKEKAVDDAAEILTDSSEYEQGDNLEADGDYEPSAYDAAGDDELPDEGTSQSAEKRTRKRKKRSDNVEGELETSGRFTEKARCRNRNHINFEVHDADNEKERGAAVETKRSGRKKRKFRKERKADELDSERDDAKWVKSLRGPHLRLMQSLKELGTERVNTIKEDTLYNSLTPAALRVIGIILEEHVKEQLSMLGSEESGDGQEKMQDRKSSSPDGLRPAENGHSVDDVDGTQTDHEVHIRPTGRKKRKSSHKELSSSTGH